MKVLFLSTMIGRVDVAKAGIYGFLEVGLGNISDRWAADLKDKVLVLRCLTCSFYVTACGWGVEGWSIANVHEAP